MDFGRRISDCGWDCAAPRRNEHQTGSASHRNPKSAADQITSVGSSISTAGIFSTSAWLPSNDKRCRGIDYEVLLIDNGSTDGSVDFVRERFPGVRVIALARNGGFTGAEQYGFRLSPRAVHRAAQ